MIVQIFHARHSNTLRGSDSFFLLVYNFLVFVCRNFSLYCQLFSASRPPINKILFFFHFISFVFLLSTDVYLNVNDRNLLHFILLLCQYFLFCFKCIIFACTVRIKPPTTAIDKPTPLILHHVVILLLLADDTQDWEDLLTLAAFLNSWTKLVVHWPLEISIWRRLHYWLNHFHLRIQLLFFKLWIVLNILELHTLFHAMSPRRDMKRFLSACFEELWLRGALQLLILIFAIGFKQLLSPLFLILSQDDIRKYICAFLSSWPLKR